MTHYTNETAYQSIMAEGVIHGTKWGLFGPGTYMTTIGRPINWFVPKASTVPITVVTPSGTIRCIPKLVYLKPFGDVFL